VIKRTRLDADLPEVVRRPLALPLLAYLGVQLAVVGAYLTAGDPTSRITVNVVGDAVTIVFALVGTVAVGRDRLTGWLAVVSIALLGLGDELSRQVTGPGGEVPYPGVPDLAYCAGSLLLVVLFVVVAARTRRGSYGGAWLDTALASAGLVIITVQFGLAQALDSGDPMSVAVSLLYGSVDLVGIVVAVWCLVSGRAITAGVGLVAACCSIWYLSDLSYTVLTLTGAYTAGGLLDLGWYVANAILAWSCWTGVSTRDDASRPGVGHTRRLLLAGGVGLLGPIGLIVASAVGLQVSNLALVCSTVLPMALALARMHGLLRRLEHQAAYDHLTGLLSRAEFARRAEHDLAERRAGAVLLIDVDGFKRVNDTLGHSAGDAVLVEVARRIQEWAPPGSVLGRLGGDEFAVVLPAHRPGLRTDPRGLAPLLRVPLAASDGLGTVTASVGVVLLDDETRAWTLDAVLAEADRWMYRQKPAVPGQTSMHRQAAPGAMTGPLADLP
jgi:diguanylate cyclase